LLLQQTTRTARWFRAIPSANGGWPCLNSSLSVRVPLSTFRDRSASIIIVLNAALRSLDQEDTVGELNQIVYCPNFAIVEIVVDVGNSPTQKLVTRWRWITRVTASGNIPVSAHLAINAALHQLADFSDLRTLASKSA
jgi:hypothetical protein